MSKKALITGITGQDGAFLAKQLLDKGYEVYGTVRRGSDQNFRRLKYLNIYDCVKYVPFEITEFSNILLVLKDIKPNYIYNLAAQSFVQESFINPIYTSQVNYIGVLNLLEAIRLTGQDIKFYQASTSEMFGDVKAIPQNENTPFMPLSPYGVSKVAAHYLINNYREAYDIFCVAGILFNHESELRGSEFVTRKITMKLSEIKLGSKKPVELGNLDSSRDWGYAGDYTQAMIKINENTRPKDYVVATNTEKTVREFFKIAALKLGFEPEFIGQNEHEKCIDKKTGIELCVVNKLFYRPSDVVFLKGDYTSIYNDCGWKPTTSLEKMIEKMIDYDMKNLK